NITDLHSFPTRRSSDLYEYADGTKLNSQIRTVLGTFNKGGAYFQGTQGTANVREGIKDRAGKSIWRHRGSESQNPYQLEHDQFLDRKSTRLNSSHVKIS